MYWMATSFVVLSSCHLIVGHGDHHHGNQETTNGNWTHTADLKKIVGVDFKWEATDPDYVLMEMSSKTMGYVSVGFCPEWHGSMEGCDLVIGWVDDTTGKGHLNDYHALSNTVPVKDTSQDYELISAKQTGFLTTITFKRKWNTGDVNDADLEKNKVQLIWSWHPEDVDSQGIIKAHDKNTRGHTRVMISMKSPPEENSVHFKKIDSLLSSTRSSTAATSLIVATFLALVVLQDM
ncbi:unnamed protein product [Allacma fusca]|uniref:DOMON domain-containing protein n=1 Tax=Allacma fusca TaxID=39272 RepID=A0A8J2JZR6_9HEXA|nr:unnamed protein product [Allacma fusca]